MILFMCSDWRFVIFVPAGSLCFDGFLDYLNSLSSASILIEWVLRFFKLGESSMCLKFDFIL